MATTSHDRSPSWGRRTGPLARQTWNRAWERIKAHFPGGGRLALLYFASALFALVTIYTSTNPLYQVWGRMALSPFASAPRLGRRSSGSVRGAADTR